MKLIERINQNTYLKNAKEFVVGILTIIGASVLIGFLSALVCEIFMYGWDALNWLM